MLGPGAANNSNLGGALVPTIAFGVPGSVTMAVLLGAFIIQGLVPGPPMLLPEAQGGHLTLTFSFVWIVVVANIITVGCCFLFLRQLARITEVRGSLVIPFVLVLIYLGAFAGANAFADLFVVLIFGLLGWVMVQLDWPRPPLILGLVLGPLAENNLFLTYDNYGFTWLRFPSVIFLLALMLAGAVYPLLSKRRARAQLAPIEPIPPSRTHSWHVVLSALFVAIIAWALWEARSWGFRARLFPWVIGVPVLALAITQLGLDLAAAVSTRGVESMASGNDATPVARRTAVIAGWILAFFATIWLLGFSIAVPLCIWLYLTFGSREKWWLAVMMTGLAWVAFYGLFEYTLHVPFPEGLVWRLI